MLAAATCAPKNIFIEFVLCSKIATCTQLVCVSMETLPLKIREGFSPGGHGPGNESFTPAPKSKTPNPPTMNVRPFTWWYILRTVITRGREVFYSQLEEVPTSCGKTRFGKSRLLP